MARTKAKAVDGSYTPSSSTRKELSDSDDTDYDQGSGVRVSKLVRKSTRIPKEMKLQKAQEDAFEKTHGLGRNVGETGANGHADNVPNPGLELGELTRKSKAMEGKSQMLSSKGGGVGAGVSQRSVGENLVGKENDGPGVRSVIKERLEHNPEEDAKDVVVE